MTYGERLVQMSTLTGVHMAKEHYANISTGGGGSVDGVIVLKRGEWNFFSIYRKNAFVKEYFFDRLADQEGVGIEDLIEDCCTYYGEKVVSFIPNSTPAGSIWNFGLVDSDDTARGIWVKMKVYTHKTDDLRLSWSSE